MSEHASNLTLRHLRDLRSEVQELRLSFETLVVGFNSSTGELRSRIIAAEMRLEYFEKHFVTPPADAP